MHAYKPEESFAIQLDTADPLARYRDEFHIPIADDGTPLLYFAGNSLGLQPKSVAALLKEELEDWAKLGVEAHFKGRNSWYRYHEALRQPIANLLGANEDEVVVMNSLTVNLHLMMVSFFHPTATRFKIIMEAAAFPSDTYAVTTQLAYHGLNPSDALILAKPRPDEYLIRQDDIERIIAEQGDSIALILMGGVNYYTGQVFEMERITRLGHDAGIVVGWDLAHAVGNIPLCLHDWDADFAVWCNYKYLNSGPGAVGGCFVHQRHAMNTDLPRFGGWWGNDPDSRFKMHLESQYHPLPSADGWQISNPPILALAPIRASLELFEQASMDALRTKSIGLTGYLLYLLERIECDRITIISPRDETQRGCQVSLFIHERAKELMESLQASGVICDFREPDVIRIAPVPLYNTYHEVWRFAEILQTHVRTIN